jgi:hypothetical protein
VGSGDAECAERGPVLLSAKHEGAGVSTGERVHVIEGMRDGGLKKVVTVLRPSSQWLGGMSDSDHSDFATRSPDEPFHVVWVARENYGFLAKSYRHHNGVNDIRRSGYAKQPPCFVRLALA